MIMIMIDWRAIDRRTQRFPLRPLGSAMQHQRSRRSSANRHSMPAAQAP
jgi:hypothetical protein